MESDEAIKPDEVLPAGTLQQVAFAVLIRDEGGRRTVGLSVIVKGDTIEQAVTVYKNLDAMDKLADGIKGAVRQARTGLQVVQSVPADLRANPFRVDL
jgi:hypothetical protein